MYGLFHTFLKVEAFHKLNILVELFFKVFVLELHIFKLLLHLLFIHLIHKLVHFLHHLLNFVAHHLVEQTVQFLLFLHQLFALVAVFVFKTLVFLHLLAHLFQMVFDLFMLLFQLFQLFFVLPREFLLVNKTAHKIVDFFLQLLQVRDRRFGSATDVG